MPWKSLKQERWGNSPAGHKALGDAGVREWNSASKGKKLPMKKEEGKKHEKKESKKKEKAENKGKKGKMDKLAEKHFFGSKYSK